MSPLAIAPTAQKCGIKKLALCSAFGEMEKIGNKLCLLRASHAEPPFAFPKSRIGICPTLRFNSEIQGFSRSETRRRRGERATKRL